MPSTAAPALSPVAVGLTTGAGFGLAWAPPSGARECWGHLRKSKKPPLFFFSAAGGTALGSLTFRGYSRGCFRLFFAMAGAGSGAIDCCSGFILVAVGLTTGAGFGFGLGASVWGTGMLGSLLRKSKKLPRFSSPPPEALHWDP